jgi:exonuclease III
MMAITRSHNQSSKKPKAHLERPRAHQQAELRVAPEDEARPAMPPKKSERNRHPAPRRGSRITDLELSTWNTMGYSTDIDHQVQALLKTKDVLALTECYKSIQPFARAGLLVAETPPVGDRAGAAAIALSPKAQGMVISSGSKGSRLCWVRLKGAFNNLFIVSAYIPHKHRHQSPFQEDTLGELQVLINTLSCKGDCVIVMGDMNAKIQRSLKGVSGRFSMHAKADSGGERLTEIMQATNLVAVATFFCPPRKAPLGNATYRPVNKSHNPSQIDHILISQKWLGSCCKCKVQWAPAITRHLEPMDHGLLTMSFEVQGHRQETSQKVWRGQGMARRQGESSGI